MSSAPDEAKEASLREFVERRYRVRVETLHRLDKGVFNANLEDGRRWVVRVFPTGRTLEQVEGDAAVLQFLEQQGFPAERCADARPASFVMGRAFLVTQYIEGVTPTPDERTLTAFGELIGRLHQLPAEDGALAREAGALHHYVRGGGGPQQELEAAANWLTEIEAWVPPERRARYESLREQVASADTCQQLPQALIHPDPVLKNLLTSSGDLVLIDWTGAGRGPRLASLAILIWSCALQQGAGRRTASTPSWLAIARRFAWRSRNWPASRLCCASARWSLPAGAIAMLCSTSSRPMAANGGGPATTSARPSPPAPWPPFRAKRPCQNRPSQSHHLQPRAYRRRWRWSS